MTSEAPPFWWERPDWRARSLFPVSAIYGAVAGYRMRVAPRERSDVPVLCIGNFTVGGTGKTPAAIAFAKAARSLQLLPGFVSRGYGGNLFQPHVVDPHHDSAKRVGDEALLLAEHGPVAVSPNRAAGVKLLTEQGCDIIIMDDGFQSAKIHIDYALLVIDASRGLGNGHMIPGGPLRAPLIQQLRHADGILKMGSGEAADHVVRLAARANKPVFVAATRPFNGRMDGRRFLAFAGIGNPGRFFQTVRDLGGEIVRTREFSDHHVFSEDDMDDLSALAAKEGLELITTEKDAVRLRHGSKHETAFLAMLEVVRIETVFEIERTPVTVIEETLAAWRKRNAMDGLRAPDASATPAAAKRRR